MDDKISLNVFDQEQSCANQLDFEHWSKAAYWTVEETAALLLSRKPEFLNVQTAKQSNGKSETANKFERLVTLLERASDAKILPNNRPSAWLNWASDANIEFDERLSDAVAANSFATINYDTFDITASKELSSDAILRAPTNVRRASDETRAKETLLKIILGMAMEQYGYDARATKNSAASQISSDLALHDISVSEDTIRKYLNEAKELLP